MLKSSLFFAGGALAVTATAANAGQLVLDVEIPQQKVAEYHKPYVAGWLENASGAHAGNLFVWYDIKKREGGGQKWLQDMRVWWRKSGRDLKMPVDGVSSATRAPGRQTLTIDTAKIAGLKPGAYVLVVEASREAGGHDLVKVPFTYNPAKGGTAAGRGDGELGAVTVTYKP